MASVVPLHGGGFIVLASFFACGFIGQILVVNGIMQVTPVNQIPVNRSGSNYHQPAIDYRNYHYQSIIAKVHRSGVKVTSVEDAIKTGLTKRERNVTISLTFARSLGKWQKPLQYISKLPFGLYGNEQQSCKRFDS